MPSWEDPYSERYLRMYHFQICLVSFEGHTKIMDNSLSTSDHKLAIIVIIPLTHPRSHGLPEERLPHPLSSALTEQYPSARSVRRYYKQIL